MARDFFGGLVIFALAALYYIGSTGIQRSTLADTLGAQGMPEAYAAALAILAAILTIRGGIGWLSSASASTSQSAAATGSPGRAAAGDGTARRKIMRMAGMFLIGAAYLVVIRWAGYTVAIAGLVSAVALYLGAAATPKLFATALVGAAVFWFLFVWLLQVPQPAGLFTGLL